MNVYEIAFITTSEDKAVLKGVEAVSYTHLDVYKRQIFVYPYGRYGDTVISTLKKYHYKAAFSTDKGTRHCLTTVYALPRLRVGNAGPSVYGF